MSHNTTDYVNASKLSVTTLFFDEKWELQRNPLSGFHWFCTWDDPQPLLEPLKDKCIDYWAASSENGLVIQNSPSLCEYKRVIFGIVSILRVCARKRVDGLVSQKRLNMCFWWRSDRWDIGALSSCALPPLRVVREACTGWEPRVCREQTSISGNPDSKRDVCTERQWDKRKLQTF